MTIFKAISSFGRRLENLLSVRRGVYAGVKEEIKQEFRCKTIEQIRQNNDKILLDDELIVIKLRLPDRKQHLSKRDGYRLIYMVFKTQEIIVFLDIYPKREPMQQFDIDDNTLASLIETYWKESENGTLENFD